MNRVLVKFLWLFVQVYIDDIVVYSKTFDDHIQHLDYVLGAIANANITLSVIELNLATRVPSYLCLDACYILLYLCVAAE